MTTYFEVRVYDHPQDDPMTYCTTQLENLAGIVDNLRGNVDEAGGVELSIKDGMTEVTVEVRL